MANQSEDQFPNHLLYAYYKDAGQNSALIVPAVLMNIAGLPGILANLLLILVTWRKRTMRGSANYLLALTAFFEILHQSAHFLFLFIALSGLNFISYSTAIHFQIHSIFGVAAAQTIMMSTAADRLLSVLMPWRYKFINGFFYLFVHTLLAFCCGGWMAWNALEFASIHPEFPVTGYISDLLVLDMEVMYHFIMTLCALNIILYALVWAIVRYGPIGGGEWKKILFRGWMAGTQQSDQRNAKLFKCLVVIVLIVIGGYMINNLCKLVINHAFTLNDVQIWSVNVFGGILLNIGASAETPTLYIFSTEYRKAINQELANLFCISHKNNSKVMVISLSHHHQSFGGNLRPNTPKNSIFGSTNPSTMATNHERLQNLRRHKNE